jgi:hypothetical protein
MNITFPDGSLRQFEAGITGLEIAKSISEGLGRAAIGIKVNGMTLDLSSPIIEDSSINIQPESMPSASEVLSAELSAELPLETYEQENKRSFHFETPNVGGPSWNLVLRRVTKRKDTGETIEDLDPQGLFMTATQGKIPGGPFPIITTFYYHGGAKQPSRVQAVGGDPNVY